MVNACSPRRRTASNSIIADLALFVKGYAKKQQ